MGRYVGLSWLTEFRKVATDPGNPIDSSKHCTIAAIVSGVGPQDHIVHKSKTTNTPRGPSVPMPSRLSRAVIFGGFILRCHDLVFFFFFQKNEMAISRSPHRRGVGTTKLDLKFSLRRARCAFGSNRVSLTRREGTVPLRGSYG